MGHMDSDAKGGRMGERGGEVRTAADQTPGNRRGSMGAGAGRGTRASLRYLQSILKRSQDLADSELDGMVAHAKAVRDDPQATHRDRLRANELLAKLAEMGVRAAADADKMERLDEGSATENNRVSVDYGGQGRQWSG